MITDAKSFGEALRKRRKELGYTQAFLAWLYPGFSLGVQRLQCQLYFRSGKRQEHRRTGQGDLSRQSAGPGLQPDTEELSL